MFSLLLKDLNFSLLFLVTSSTAESRSGLLLLPWSCYAKVTQLFLSLYCIVFDYLLARVIGFLAMYHDGVLCATKHDREAILGQNTPFSECYAVALLFWSFLDFYCIMSAH